MLVFRGVMFFCDLIYGPIGSMGWYIYLHLAEIDGFHVGKYTLGYPPSQDASHHQDYEPFLVGIPT